MKNEKLTQDEFDALEQIRRGVAHERMSACVGRNVKRLSGLKLVAYAKNGTLSVTEKAESLMFLRRCVLGLRAVARGPLVVLDADVATFLEKKSHIAATASGGMEITAKGRESLADIDTQERNS